MDFLKNKIMQKLYKGLLYAIILFILNDFAHIRQLFAQNMKKSGYLTILRVSYLEDKLRLIWATYGTNILQLKLFEYWLYIKIFLWFNHFLHLE
jgi:hypothetical protein